MKVVEYFGPRIAKTKLTKEECQELLQLCYDSNLPAGQRLLGNVREQKGITEGMLKSKVYHTINANMERYIKEIDSGMWEPIMGFDEIDSYLEMTEAWYNKQTNMEYSVPHNHNRSCDLVCVIFPKIELDNNIKFFKTNSNFNQVGQLLLSYGEDIKNEFGRSLIQIHPEEGDMIIFPSSTVHYTNTVLGNSVRYSVSCNYVFNSNAFRLLQKYFKKQKNEIWKDK